MYLDINAHLSWRNIVENFVYLALWNYVFYLGILAIKFIQPTEYQRSLLLSALGIILFSMGFYTLFGKYELAKIEHIPILAFGSADFMVCTVCLFTYSKAVSFICAFYFDCFCSRTDFLWLFRYFYLFGHHFMGIKNTR